MTGEFGDDLVLLMSDLHAHYHVVDAQVTHAEELIGRPIVQVIVLGDFGLFGPDMHRYFRRGKHRFLRPVSFIDGNHEDFVAFDRLVAQYDDVVTYLPRSSVHRLGRLDALCLGGARYMDAWSTPRGSEITEEDIAHAFAVAPGAVDMVLSHDCPSGIGVNSAPDLDHLGEPGIDSLARLADHLRPRLWVFGHHHRWHDLERDGTRYLGLPQSWQGFAIIDGAGEIRRIDHEVRLPRRPRWWRLIGLRS